ncbi:hypothetical protein DB347_09255 [Opitutaceae bacterium EW11]|nr:hypothetical protein DB347_09255 [Opitutaceae bacterium EW11]
MSRAQKIVDALALADGTLAAQVRSAVAEHYEKLHALHEARDKEIAGMRSDAALDAAAKTAATDRIRRETEIGVRDLHYAFFAELSVMLLPEQVEKVKDGLTYGVLPLTYRVYCEMLPSLTAEQKSQILAWLTEAREHAVDGGSSEEKHGWFGKYKGRINNYLAKAGYDMKKAEHELQEKHKAARNAPAP